MQILKLARRVTLDFMTRQKKFASRLYSKPVIREEFSQIKCGTKGIYHSALNGFKMWSSVSCIMLKRNNCCCCNCCNYLM